MPQHADLIRRHVHRFRQQPALERLPGQEFLLAGLGSRGRSAKASYTFSWTLRFEYLRKHYLGLPVRKLRDARPAAAHSTGDA